VAFTGTSLGNFHILARIISPYYISILAAHFAHLIFFTFDLMFYISYVIFILCVAYADVAGLTRAGAPAAAAGSAPANSSPSSAMICVYIYIYLYMYV